jgi:Ca2+:H+ antiporter
LPPSLLQVFESIALFISVVLANAVISEGKSHWMQGLVLLATYAIVAVAFFSHASGVALAEGGGEALLR